MISFVSNVIVGEPVVEVKALLFRIWRWYHPEPPDVPVPTLDILDVVERVRAAEARLAQLKHERNYHATP